MSKYTDNSIDGHGQQWCIGIPSVVAGGVGGLWSMVNLEATAHTLSGQVSAAVEGVFAGGISTVLTVGATSIIYGLAVRPIVQVIFSRAPQQEP